MSFTHVLISRPQPESEELASKLAELGLQTIVQPSFHYYAADLQARQPEVLAEMQMAGAGTLLVFTSTRAVTFGLPQLPETIRHSSRIAAIGPATARALQQAGIRVDITPVAGYTSEALLEALLRESPPADEKHPLAFIISAPGGRQTLYETLGGRGWRCRLVMAYRPEPAQLNRQVLGRLDEANGILSVWTSSNAMKALSQRLPPATWFRICQGDWLVVSDRLKRLARAYGPAAIHLAPGPGNQELFSAIRNLSR